MSEVFTASMAKQVSDAAIRLSEQKTKEKVINNIIDTIKTLSEDGRQYYELKLASVDSRFIPGIKDYLTSNKYNVDYLSGGGLLITWY